MLLDNIKNIRLESNYRVELVLETTWLTPYIFLNLSCRRSHGIIIVSSQLSAKREQSIQDGK